MFALFRRNRHVNAASKARAVRIADAAPGALVRIEGGIELDETSLVSPILRRPCVLHESRVELHCLSPGRSEPIPTSWDVVHDVAFVPFWVVDDAGARVRVRKAPAVVWIPVPDVSGAPAVDGPRRTFIERAQSQGVVPFAPHGWLDAHRFYEGGLVPGDRVSVYGRVTETAAAVTQGYRDAAGSVLELDGAEDAPLVIRRA